MKRAAVIGAGTMGNGIAHVFAQHGWEVALIDTVPAALEKATATIRSNLDRQVKKGTLPPEAPAQVLGHIKTGTALEAAKQAEIVVEAASENPAVKFDLDHRDRRPNSPGGTSHRYALHESGAGHAARGGHSGACHQRCHDGRGDGGGSRAGQDAG
jgi:2-polyprenyl-6-methoxyphenol hydroxylase-like FAD-dependent oxidoreductase